MSPQPTPSRPPVVLIAVGVVAAIVAIAVAFTLIGGSDDDVATGAGGTEGAAGVLSFAPVTVEGAGLPLFESADDDAAVGQSPPMLVGSTPEGTPSTVGEPGEPTLVVFLAHWCPHCQRELPVLVEVAGEGGFDGVQLRAVLTGTNPDAPNFPPAAWLESEGWPGEVFVDDEAFTAARAYGLATYPYLVAIDADGTVVGRASGELPPEDLRALADLARGD